LDRYSRKVYPIEKGLSTFSKPETAWKPLNPVMQMTTLFSLDVLGYIDKIWLLFDRISTRFGYSSEDHGFVPLEILEVFANALKI
jgi:hypothetical protein